MNKILQAIVWALLIVSQTVHAQALEELFKAVEEGNIKRTEFYLDRGLDPNSTDASGTTILMVASRMGHTELASVLLERKASVSHQT